MVEGVQQGPVLAGTLFNMYRVPGLKNELCDWLSRANFDQKTSATSESLSREPFQKMNVHLDLTMSKAELLSSLRKSDYLEEYGDILKALGDGSYALVDKAHETQRWEYFLRTKPSNEDYFFERRKFLNCWNALWVPVLLQTL